MHAFSFFLFFFAFFRDTQHSGFISGRGEERVLVLHERHEICTFMICSFGRIHTLRFAAQHDMRHLMETVRVLWCERKSEYHTGWNPARGGVLWIIFSEKASKTVPMKREIEKKGGVGRGGEIPNIAQRRFYSKVVKF